MWLKILQAIGLTNLSDHQVEEYTALSEPRSEYAERSPMLALFITAASLTGFFVSVHLANQATLDATKRAHAESADKILQNSTIINEELTSIRTRLAEISRSQISPPLKGQLLEIDKQIQVADATNSKIRSKAAIDKYANSKDFKVGAIVTSKVTKVYKPDQREQFVKDAEQFIDNHPVDDTHLGRGWDPDSQTCDAPTEGCVSLLSRANLPSNLSERVEAIFTDKPLRTADALDALSDKQLAASFRVSGQPLCSWLSHLADATLLAAELSR